MRQTSLQSGRSPDCRNNEPTSLAVNASLDYATCESNAMSLKPTMRTCWTHSPNSRSLQPPLH
jgi:hypothetical protein